MRKSRVCVRQAWACNAKGKSAVPGTKKEREGLTATFSMEVGAGARKIQDRVCSSHTCGARVFRIEGQVMAGEPTLLLGNIWLMSSSTIPWMPSSVICRQRQQRRCLQRANMKQQAPHTRPSPPVSLQ